MELNDGIECSGFQDCSTLNLTDFENEGQDSTSTEHGEGRGLKRGYGMVVDSAELSTSLAPERRLRTPRMHEQFALLRSSVPNSCTVSKIERASILTSACEYIEKLQRQEAELRCELGLESSCEEEELSSCEDEVEVVRTEEGSLRIHIDCRMRPCLLREIMELLESSGLKVEGANVNCMERLIFDGIGLEDVEGMGDGGESSSIRRVSAEFINASLRSLIGDQRQENTL